MKPLTPSQRIKLWFAINEWAHGAIVIGAATVVIGTAVGVGVYFGHRTGPDVESEAVIVALGYSPAKGGGGPKAVVRLPDGATYTLGLRHGHYCQTGDTVTVRTTPRGQMASRTIVFGGCNR